MSCEEILLVWVGIQVGHSVDKLTHDGDFHDKALILSSPREAMIFAYKHEEEMWEISARCKNGKCVPRT